jgi:hypothetical protein
MKRILTLMSLVLLLSLALPVTAFASGLQDGRVVFGGTYTLRSGETLSGDLAVIGGAAILQTDSLLNGDVVVVGGNLEGNGEITGDVVVVGGNVTLLPNAVVRGDLVTFGGNLDPGSAQIDGEIVSAEGLDIPFDFENFNFRFDQDWDWPFRGVPAFRFSTQARVVAYLFESFMMAALAVLVVIFWPKPTKRVADAIINQPVVSGGLGLLTAIVGPILLILLLITVCLAPVSVIGVILLVVAAVFGWIGLGLEVGERLATALNQDYQPAVAAGLGTLVFSLVVNGIGFIPCVGWLVPLLVAALGLGGVLVTRFGTQAYVPTSVSATTDEMEIVEVPPPDAPEEKKSTKK